MRATLCGSLHQAHRAVHRFLAEDLFDIGLAPGSDRLVMALFHSERPYASALASELGVQRSTVTRLLRKLEQARYVKVERRDPDDVRIRPISLTPMGEFLRDMMKNHPSPIDDKLMHDWSPDEREHLIVLLDRVRWRAEQLRQWGGVLPHERWPIP